MSRRTRVARQALTTNQQIEAVFAHHTIYELGLLIPTKEKGSVGRRSDFPGYLLVAYGVLARLFRSGIRVQTELKDPSTWQLVCDTVARVQRDDPDLVPVLPGHRPPPWDAFRYARDRYLTDPDLLADLQGVFTECAVDQAHDLGLLDPKGPGSFSHPHRSRVVYGDGTVVRPLYAPPPATRATDTKTGKSTVVYLDGRGEPIDAPIRRFDPDAADYHGHTGSVHGQNFVALYARGDEPYQRVVLAVDRVPAPGQEAATAVGAIKRLHQVVGAGIQAIVYDGAMRGTHIDDLMTNTGLLVINKVHASAKTARRRGKASPASRWFALGTWEHDVPSGLCTHQLAAVDGAVSEVALDDAGKPVVLGRLERKQVKRPRRASGLYHFNVAYEVPCESGAFLAWVTPHGEPGDAKHRRADAVRVIAEGEPDFDRLYGLRNDAESFNSQLKRSLLVGRAMSLGGRRQLLDVLCYAVLHNATNEYRAAAARGARPAAATHLRAA